MDAAWRKNRRILTRGLRSEVDINPILIFSQIRTPRKHEFSSAWLDLALVVGKDFFDDLEEGLTVEDLGVGAVRQEAQLRLDQRSVARQVADAAQQGDLGDGL
jgi:hypothetical protein